MSTQQTHRDVEINAYAEMCGIRYVPIVILKKQQGARSKELKLYPPCQRAFATEREAERVALDYGIAALNGTIDTFDPSGL